MSYYQNAGQNYIVNKP